MSTEQLITAAVEQLQQGTFVAVSDDNDREHEADLIIAAEYITVEQMAFLIRHTSGIICTPITAQRQQELDLPRLQSSNPSHFDTPFTMPIDYMPATRGGVSAEERTATVHALVDPQTDPNDFGKPGHVFPLVAVEGGVLERSGHTEAAMDLMKLANLKPVSVIGELMNTDGTMMRGSSLEAFLEEHNILHITIAELVEYIRLAQTEKKEYNV